MNGIERDLLLSLAHHWPSFWREHSFLGHSWHVFCVLLSFQVFLIHGRCQNKHRCHTWTCIFSAQQKHISSSSRVRGRGNIDSKSECSAHNPILVSLIKEGKRQVVIASLMALWLVIIIIIMKSLGLCWSCNLSFSGNYRDGLTGHFNHGCILIKVSYEAMMLQGKNFILKKKVCCYFILEMGETNRKGTVLPESWIILCSPSRVTICSLSAALLYTKQIAILQLTVKCHL